ncbi:unnamed protein product [Rotaria sp. Silwood2]|nr:unnamed protein product [Rotaria sp. Silwood2]CAF4772802.1 unnamed protein product [Rotaria sp. Silwood2]
MSTVSFLTTNKGKPLLVLNQYTFKCNKITAAKKYWICTDPDCYVYVHTNLENELLPVTGDHNHVADPNMLEIKLLKNKMKNRILLETTSITKIYDEEISQAYLSEEGAAAFPTVIEYHSNMGKARRKKTPVIPTSCVFGIPMSYQQTLRQERFLLMDYFQKRGTERIIVYATDLQLKLLFNSKKIFVDDTFSTAPNGFDQVFLIHDQQLGQTGVPVVFCLLSNRRTTTYIELFQRFKHEAKVLGEQFQPKYVVSDFEGAIIAAVQHELLNVSHTGCLFHFVQSINRKIISLGLGTAYAQDATIREQCKQLMALILMPIEEIEGQFKRIREISSTALDDLFIYFERQWINGNVPLSMWNVNVVDDRTNNVSDGNQKLFLFKNFL